MFDFLRNLRDEVAAEVSLMGICGKNTSSLDDKRKVYSFDISDKDDKEYLLAIGYEHGSIYPAMMRKIIDNNLQNLSPDLISKKLNLPILTPERIQDILDAYAVMNFLKEKEYSAEEARDIMNIANIYDGNKEKSVSEVAVLADCSEDSIHSVIKLLTEFKNRMQQKPFTMESASPNSGQKPVVQPPKTTSSKTNKKTATAAS